MPSQPQLITVHMNNEKTVQVAPIAVEGDLAVHKTPEYDNLYSITHTASGYGVWNQFGNRKRTVKALQELIHMGIDWTKDFDTVVQSMKDNAEAIRSIINRFK